MSSISPVKIFLLALFLAVSVHAQGTLRGVVTDSLTGEELVGANIFLPGTSLGAASNLDGRYNIPNIPSGTHTVKVTYIGYRTKEYTVTIAGGRITELDVKIIPDIIEGEEVLITAQAAGQAAAINQQRSSNTIINVVSEEKIKELPDANAAESIGRLPGVSILRSGGEANKVILRGLSDKYTNVTIDGIRISSTDSASRGLDLSTISQSSLAGIELYKALTPDKDGDAIAGTINLVTKRAPSKRELRIELKGGYNDVMSSAKQYDFNLRYGERFFDEFLGVQVGGNLEHRIRSNERINLDYDQTINNQTDYIINDFFLEFTDEVRKRNGANVMLDINTPDDGSIKLSNIYSSTERDLFFSRRDYPSGGGTGGTVTYSFQDRQQKIKTFNSSLIGNNNLLDLKLYWGLSFAQSTVENPYDYNLEFLEPSIGGSAGMRNTPTIKTNPEQLIPYAYNNFNATNLYNAYYRDQENFDKEKTAFLNISKEYVLSDLFSGELKVGGKYRTKDRSSEASILYSPYYLGYWQPYERMADGSIVNKNYSGSYFEAFYQRFQQSSVNRSISLREFMDSDSSPREIYDLYTLDPLINRDKLRQWYELNKRGVDQNGNTVEYNDDPTAKAGQYDITERVAATYIMNTLNIGQVLTFIAGVRIEHEDNDYTSTYSPLQIGGFPIPTGVVRDTSASHSETIVLPNFHFNIKPTELLNIRIAAYKALARPDFNYRLNTSFAWRGADVSSNKEQFVGNPNLKTAEAWNFEVNTSYYGNEIGLVSFSAYYKEIKNQHHILNQINTSGNVLFEYFNLESEPLHTGTYQLTVPYNSPRPTKVWGFEFEHQINFVFLPGYLKNIVLSYNASLVHSETYLIGTQTDTIEYFVEEFPGIPFYRYEDRVVEVKQQLENQPKFYGNIALGYDIGGFSGRLSLFHQSKYNRSFTASGRGDLVKNTFTRLDLALRYKFTDFLSAILNINNLTNIKEGESINNRVNGYTILNTEERYGLTADFGIKFEL